ncbi:MAG: alpha/beta hydrolase [Lachnospiraceae bacterium]|nr:alpha/beta hydrolase [Lachnospiraceae bacterium]
MKPGDKYYDGKVENTGRTIHKDVADYAQAFADSGIAAYIFDFIGGGTQIKSDGKMTEMSVLTEAADFNVVFDGIRELSCIDKPRLFVGGASQGGFVATYIAAKRNPDISGLIALYPAYVLQDDARKRTSDGKDIPETVHIMGRTVGRKYS